MMREFKIGAWLAYTESGEIHSPSCEYGNTFLSKREAVEDIALCYDVSWENLVVNRLSSGRYGFAVHSSDAHREVTKYYVIERITNENYNRLLSLFFVNRDLEET